MKCACCPKEIELSEEIFFINFEQICKWCRGTRIENLVTSNLMAKADDVRRKPSDWIKRARRDNKPMEVLS